MLFDRQFQQFSTAVADAAVLQQQTVRNAFRSASNAITTLAYTNNATWPFYTVPYFETLAKNFVIQSRAEIFTIFPRVGREQRAAWDSYSSRNYQSWVKEDHLLRYGDLSHLDDNTSKFHPFITMSGPSGSGLVPEVVKDQYFVSWCNSPPPMTYGMINWDVSSLPDTDSAIRAALTLKTDTVCTHVRPYSKFVLLSQ